MAAHSQSPAKKPSLAEAQASLKIPPDWFVSLDVAYDTNKPWKDARLEIRNRLAQGGDKARQAVKLTWLYAQKKDINDGHELPMYLFMSGEYAWAIQESEKFLKEKFAQPVPAYGYTNAFNSLASCYAHFGEYDKALKTLDEAVRHLPKAPLDIGNKATISDIRGDIYAEMGDMEKARASYLEAIDLFPKSQQPYGRHLLKRHAAKVQAKLDLMQRKALDLSKLRDGVYTGTELGYVDDVTVKVTVRDRRIADIEVTHKEKIDQNATKIIPQRIIERQDLKVDGITGATVTCQAIVNATYKALQQAGLK
ncbi:MAG: tetratricopeptide repeat protein [Candidatus Sumerlaeota bacterium]|nr:tetratricopeptide repeat protein [Candidatus Sumerlaeota bacterium]